jgi:hypothetical protein
METERKKINLTEESLCEYLLFSIHSVTGLLRIKTGEPEGMAVGRQWPINNNNVAAFSVCSMPFLCSPCRQWCHARIGEPLEVVFLLGSCRGFINGTRWPVRTDELQLRVCREGTRLAWDGHQPARMSAQKKRNIHHWKLLPSNMTEHSWIYFEVRQWTVEWSLQWSSASKDGSRGSVARQCWWRLKSSLVF